MIRIERAETTFIIAVGSYLKHSVTHATINPSTGEYDIIVKPRGSFEGHRIPTAGEVIRSFAEDLTSRRIRSIQLGESTWECGEWSMRAAEENPMRKRDTPRKRILLSVGDLRWHLLANEVVALAQSCQRALLA